jgi:O-antigen/teichoic acid export membrane protein
VLVPVYMRLLRADEYGLLSLLTITLTVVTIVLKCGLNHAFFRRYYECESDLDRRRIVGSSICFLVVFSAGSLLLLWLASPQLSSLIFRGDGGKDHLLRLIFLISFFEVINLIPDSILRARFQSARYSILNITAFVFQLGLICYLVIVVDSNVENVLLGRLGGVMFESVVFYFIVRRDLSLQFSASEIKGLLSFGAPLIFSQLAFTLFMMVDRFFLEHYSRPRDVGVYAMSNTIVSAVSVLVTAPFSQVWTVMRFSVANEAGAEEYYSRVLTYVVFASMFLALGVSAVAGDGIVLYGLHGYWSAGTLIPLLGLSAVMDGAARVLNVGTTLRGRTVFAPIVMGAALAVNVALNFLLIPAYGMLGATLSTLISYTVLCALRYWSSNMFFKVKYEWRRVFMLAVAGTATIAFFYIFDYLRETGVLIISPYLAIAVKTFAALLFPFVLLALRFYDEREQRRVREIARLVLGRSRAVVAEEQPLETPPAARTTVPSAGNR